MERRGWPGTASLLVAALAAALVTDLAACAHRPPLPLAQLSDADIIADFGRVAFGEEWRPNEGTVIRKWRTPLRVGFFGEIRSETREMARGEMALLSRLSGLPVLMDDPHPNLEIWSVDSDRFREIVERVEELGPGDLRRLRWSNCFFAFRTVAPGVIEKAVVVIPPDLSPDKTRHCIAEETAQALGLPNDSDEIPDSLFNDDSDLSALSAKDRLLLRILYHPALETGLSKPLALARIRTFLPALRHERERP